MQLHELAGTACSKHHKLIKVIGKLGFCAHVPISERCTNEVLLANGSISLNGEIDGPTLGKAGTRDSKAPLVVDSEAPSGDEATNKLGDGKTKQPIYTNGNGHGQVEAFKAWKHSIYQLALSVYQGDPEYHKAGLVWGDIVQALRNDLIVASGGATQNPRYHLPDGRTWAQAEADIDLCAEAAWEEFREKHRNALMIANGVVKHDEELMLDLPDFTKKPLVPLSWGEMRQRRAAQRRDWVVEGKLARGETSSWSGKVEGGKTTLMRELTMCVVRGEPFLGCPTEKGRVGYIMLDADGEDVTFDAFDEMGFTDADGESVFFLFETMMAQMEHGMERLAKMLLDFKPSLVIIDPYPRLKMIEDFHSYTNTYLMGQLSYFAKLLNAHLALPGHVPRGRDDDADVATAGFGSIAFSGGVNARFIVTNRNGTHTIRSSQGKGSGFKAFDAEYVLLRDDYTKRVNLGQPWSWKDKANSYKEPLLTFLNQQNDRPFDIKSLAKELRIQASIVRSAGNLLFGAQKIRREGAGIKTDPYIYASYGYTGEMTMEEVKRE